VRSHLLYYEVTKLTRIGKKLADKTAAINGENGELISEIEEVKLRWKEYIDDLCSRVDKPRMEDFDLKNGCVVDGDR